MDSSAPDLPLFLLATEAASVLRVEVQTLYQWRLSKTGPPARKVGGKLLYQRDELFAWINAQARAV